MLSRDRRRPNHAVMRRFAALCREAARLAGAETAGFHDLPPDLADRAARPLTRVQPSRLRTANRMMQQVWANWRYERTVVTA